MDALKSYAFPAFSLDISLLPDRDMEILQTSMNVSNTKMHTFTAAAVPGSHPFTSSSAGLLRDGPLAPRAPPQRLFLSS